MSYRAKVYKVFIASPSDTYIERKIIRETLAQWNTINAERNHTIFLPVGWDTNAAPEMGMPPQDYINELILDKCDILIAVFWHRVGKPTAKETSGTIEEIKRHISQKKLAMIYFSKKPYPENVDTDQLSMVRAFKAELASTGLYAEYEDERDFAQKLSNHIQIKYNEMFDKTWRDSDSLSLIQDDDELAEKISNMFPLVSRNLLEQIINEQRKDVVWDAIVEKLAKSPADFRESLTMLAKKGAFRHRVFVTGYKKLSEVSQWDFCVFMDRLYSINRFEFESIYRENLIEDKKYIEYLENIIRRDSE